MKDDRINRLYDLLPPIYRMKDAEQGRQLEALLQVISEQVDLLEDDIGRLYDNWFIETCQDWVVPYLGALVGYTAVPAAGLPARADTPQARRLNQVLIPRREVANTIRNRRRKGTLALLEELARDVAAWPARAAEGYRLLSFTQALNHQRPHWGRTLDVRDGELLDLLHTPFDRSAHTVDVRRVNSARTMGYHNLPAVALFVWRLKSYSVTATPAYYLEAVSSTAGPHCYSFSILRNDTPLYIAPEAESDPAHIADEFNLPVPIRRRLLAEQKGRLYGPNRSLQLFRGVKQGDQVVQEPIPAHQIVVADLSHWHVYAPRPRTVAVDPELGRIAFPERQWPEHGVWVRYHYGFSMDMGGGEYERPIFQPDAAKLYRVGRQEMHKTINAALTQWRQDSNETAVAHAVIEINDSGVYVEPIAIRFKPGQQSLTLRAANRRRPVIRLLDWQTDQPDALTITGAQGSRFTLDGLLITGRGVRAHGDLAELTIRHTTLVPGWSLGHDCSPQRATGASLEIESPKVCVRIEHSIVGAIQVDPDLVRPLEPGDSDDADDTPSPDDDNVEIPVRPAAETALAARCRGIGRGVRLDPIRICIADTIVDATDPEHEALGSPGCPVAHAVVTIVRSTIFGRIQAHAVELGENSIFMGVMSVVRRQIGCLRFSYVTPGSRTPRRYNCQPDLVVQAKNRELLSLVPTRPLTARQRAQIQQAQEMEMRRVTPHFDSVRYGQPEYCRLSRYCVDEIIRGADDESEMGVFHDLFQPQRSASLRVRMDEYIPAGMDVGVVFP
ncbi:hypothetical protein [Desulfatitalea tepidiphila]|uniref:hypothetical protein n=1 Tax=Desulfatitalea tepidiphila TaxID=1185843 RepID=UPI0006B66311|nr:hypothetical protein [Desulfatitalea tepidiphila]